MQEQGVTVLLVHEEELEVPGEEEEVQPVEAAVELSIKSVVGLTAPKTMKLRGTIRVKSVFVLIECGATHNFISSELVQELGLHVTGSASYGVLMGTGLSVKGGRNL